MQKGCLPLDARNEKGTPLRKGRFRIGASVRCQRGFEIIVPDSTVSLKQTPVSVSDNDYDGSESVIRLSGGAGGDEDGRDDDFIGAEKIEDGDEDNGGERLVGLFSSSDEDDQDDNEDDEEEDEEKEEKEEDEEDDGQEMPASIQSWSLLTSSSDDLSDYEYEKLTGTSQNAAEIINHGPKIAQVIGLGREKRITRRRSAPAIMVGSEEEILGIKEESSDSDVYKYCKDNDSDSDGSYFEDSPTGQSSGFRGFPRPVKAGVPSPLSGIGDPMDTYEDSVDEDISAFGLFPKQPQASKRQRLNSPAHFSGLRTTKATSSKRRKTSPAFAPAKTMAQHPQQQRLGEQGARNQQGQQGIVPARPLRSYGNQQVRRSTGFKFQPLAPPPVPVLEHRKWNHQLPFIPSFYINRQEWESHLQSEDKSVPRTAHPNEKKWGQQLTKGPPTSEEEALTPSQPLSRRGGRPVPPREADSRWNIWTVGNLEIRCTSSGVGVKHLREVLFRDDGNTGCRRSKWTHERLAAEIMVRRAQQEAEGKVVGKPWGFLVHQGWWFYI